MEEKLDRIILLLEDENVGLCPRLRKMEKTIYGNGEPGLAEQLRVIQTRWVWIISIASAVGPVLGSIIYQWGLRYVR